MISPFDEDKPKGECGIFGIYGHPDAAYLTYLGLYALQHRGQESAGIVTSDREKIYYHHGMGLVVNVFDEERLSKLEGDIAIGHNRYSTAGSSTLQNAQPLVREIFGETLGIAHNGNLINAPYLRRELENKGAIFTSTSDTEVIAHLIARSGQIFIEDRVLDALMQVRGAYSILFMTRNGMIAARDPWGFRPLWMGRLKDAVVFSSETCAFDVIEAEPEREIEPGEMVIVTPNRIRSVKFATERHAFC
ncbi:TPA: amidophosphoribosyltransferase, partial [Candidatus Poribacteria bacterium]|nr:amidophosphoribosyltransferase [Candidatus Poribacteria bacterium]